MAKTNNLTQRIDKKFFEDMNKLIEYRLKGGLLDRKDANFPKITHLITRTSAYNTMITELKTKPEKK